jgi:hypothetical protein
MVSSAAFMAALGLATTFMPQEIIASLGGSAGRTLPLLIQILGALYLGFAMLNWMAKDSLIGGIYSRPVSIGNFVHFAVGGMSLLKTIVGGERAVGVSVCAAIYVGFAVAFGAVVFGRIKST